MAQFFTCPQCRSRHVNLPLLIKHHLEKHKRLHKEFLDAYLPALRLVRLTCVFCHSHFPAKQSILDHYKVCRYNSYDAGNVDLDRLNGVVAWNTGVWLKPLFRECILKYLAERPPVTKRVVKTQARTKKINVKLPISPKSDPNNIKKNIKKNELKRPDSPRVPCPECALDYKNVKDVKVHFMGRHEKRLHHRFLHYYYPLLKDLQELPTPYNPVDNQFIKHLPNGYVQKLLSYYRTRTEVEK